MELSDSIGVIRKRSENLEGQFMADKKSEKRKRRNSLTDGNGEVRPNEQKVRDETEADESIQLAEQLKPEDQKVLNTEG